MNDWNPQQYLKFADHRLRPALDLLARVPMDAPRLVYDLGCGAGNVTKHLKARWPNARVVGVDSSAAMLDRARAEAAGCDFVLADLANWQPTETPCVIYSNAALHWLDDHASLFPRLLAALRPGGVLAVQMPRNHGAPSHTEPAAAARMPAWQDRLVSQLRENPVALPGVYRDLLAPLSSWRDIWETDYIQELSGEDAVLEWIRSTALRPLLDALEEKDRPAFEAEVRARLRRAYPRQADGMTLFPFRRLFMVAVRID